MIIDRSRVPATTGGRVELAMRLAGFPSGAALARDLKIPKQTVYRWIREGGDNITPELLFLTAERLRVSPRWLALGDVDMNPPTQLTDDDQRVLDLARSLPPAALDAWLRQGADLATLTNHRPTPAVPFIRAKTR